MKMSQMVTKVIVGLSGLGLYLMISVVLFDFDLLSMVNITYFLLVTLGIGLLALSQYKPGLGWKGLIEKARNITFLVGGITTIFAVMQALSLITQAYTKSPSIVLARALLPMLYAMIWHAILVTLDQSVTVTNPTVTVTNPATGPTNQPTPQPPTNSSAQPPNPPHLPPLSQPSQPLSNPFAPELVYRVMTQHGFTSREIHVALKLFENKSNKDIAADLFISEATVKKHIQNMFKKCDAQNRQDLLMLYLKWIQ